MFYERECQEKNLLLTWQTDYFLTASPAVLVITDAVVSDDHCQFSQCEQLRT
jgi:hypothetical protein